MELKITFSLNEDTLELVLPQVEHITKDELRLEVYNIINQHTQETVVHSYRVELELTNDRSTLVWRKDFDRGIQNIILHSIVDFVEHAKYMATLGSIRTMGMYAPLKLGTYDELGHQLYHGRQYAYELRKEEQTHQPHELNIPAHHYPVDMPYTRMPHAPHISNPTRPYVRTKEYVRDQDRFPDYVNDYEMMVQNGLDMSMSEKLQSCLIYSDLPSPVAWRVQGVLENLIRTCQPGRRTPTIGTLMHVHGVGPVRAEVILNLIGANRKNGRML